MSKVSDIRDAIKTIMAMVPDVGQVHTFERYAKRADDFKEFYKDQEQIRGWHIRRLTTTTAEDTMVDDEETYIWRIRGYMSLSDENETERQFDELIESIVLEFRQHNTLNGTVDTCRLPAQAGIQVERTGHVMLAGVLCHEVDLKLGCRVRA